MKVVADYIVKDLIRLLPILIDNVDLKGKSTRIENAVRLVKIIVRKLSKIEEDGREQGNNSKELHVTDEQR